ncbi:hypothetical protein DYBT9275_01675 [Dyadobacter sp. CECT 9275]|uniref:Uncharacterized protein n=1 Tax=Dyadobacter helix TaxID=2822344 RepID=A0A916JE49_9BACT|nr:hypothetical protein [Dyadobacter sp. CECT 9275]CAG4995592.1 hypothetical protein DYBT9275_01675 [Dyadobacter sp. CECT 9275]
MNNKGVDIEGQDRKALMSFATAGMTVHQQIKFQLEQGKERNPFNDIAGQWPGNETDEEFEEMLRSMTNGKRHQVDSKILQLPKSASQVEYWD